MAEVSLKALIGKLNHTCHRSLEDASGLCLSRTNYNVEIEHWLLRLLEIPNTDLMALYRFYEVNTSRLNDELTRAIDRLKRGNSRTPGLSPNIVRLVRNAWLIGSVEYGAYQVRSGHVLCALLSVELMFILKMGR